MSEITLSAATQTTLLSLQRTGAFINQTQERLATGLKVNSALDDAQAFFQAKSLNSRATTLLGIKENIDLAASTVGSAILGIESIAALLTQMRALAQTARGKSNSAAKAIAVDFDALRDQIDPLANDATFNAINLINAAPDDLTVVFNEDGSSTLTVSGTASDVSSLGVGTAGSTYDDFRDDNDIDDAVSDIDDALDTLTATAATLGANDDLLNVRLTFTDNLVTTLQEGASKLIEANVNEEAAKLLALQVRYDLGVVSLQTSADTRQVLLGLL
jgi:flagellin-like hook-associated protein FlgL